MAAQKIHATTQKFTEIVDFADDIVILEGGNACMIIEITASNFALLSKREQDSRIFSYAGMLNSLSFPIQILIRNRRMDISSYIHELEEIITSTKNEQLAVYIEYYAAFVKEMVTVNVVLNKSFFIIVPFSSLEMGITGATQTQQKKQTQKETFTEAARKVLTNKANSLLGQLQKFATSARILEKEDLIKLFYEIYNEDTEVDIEQMQAGAEASFIRGDNQQ
ncbi:MAG TPA: hypothetical protein VNW29_05145 [Candidatus Sulfotelmatobacter sp.]|jgi:hypothetical protein|nr:hypothetical protein [Candidatus Sulfotelmatobacter sp.]